MVLQGHERDRPGKLDLLKNVIDRLRICVGARLELTIVRELRCPPISGPFPNLAAQLMSFSLVNEIAQNGQFGPRKQHFWTTQAFMSNLGLNSLRAPPPVVRNAEKLT